MHGINNIVLNEICWIVQQRNEWAKRRQHYRNKFRRILKMSPAEQMQLHTDYKTVNAESAKLNKYTKRLKSLLKRVDARLGSDHNAGYARIVFNPTPDSIEIIHRDEIAVRAKDYEVDLYMTNFFKGA
jgi:hypothetical protein